MFTDVIHYNSVDASVIIMHYSKVQINLKSEFADAISPSTSGTTISCDYWLSVLSKSLLFMLSSISN